MKPAFTILYIMTILNFVLITFLLAQNNNRIDQITQLSNDQVTLVKIFSETIDRRSFKND